MVFTRLKEIKKKTKVSFLSAQCSLLVVHTLCRWYVCKMQKSQQGKELANGDKLVRITFLGLASYYCWFIPEFTAIAKCLH